MRFQAAATLLVIFGILFFNALAVFQDFQRTGTIALVASAALLVLGIFGGIAMGLLTEIGLALGKRKSERHLVILLGGFLGMFIPYVLFAGLFGLMIGMLNPPATYDIGVPMMTFFSSLLLCMVGSTGAVEPFVKKRWLAQREEK